MFKKSFLALLAAALLALAGIVAFALLGLAGPDEPFTEARNLMAARSYAEAVAVLDLHERRLRGDLPRLEQLRRLRYAANNELGNPKAALLDLDELLLQHRDDQQLRLDRIRLLALIDDGAAARAAAHQFLVEHPGHSRGLELAGETCQKLYQPRLLELQTAFERDLGLAERQPARTAMLAYVYRPEGDPQIAAAAARLRELYSTDATRLAAWPARAASIQELRTAVQEALRYFQQSLEAGGHPVAAFRAVAFALEQAQRHDDLLFACEVQRRLFEHDYVVEAGATAAWALLRAGLPAAAAATTARWLPPGTVEKALAAGNVTAANKDALCDLLLAQVHAAYQLRDNGLLVRSWFDANALSKAKLATPVLLPLAASLLQCVTDGQQAVAMLRWAAMNANLEPAPSGRIDPVPMLARLRLQYLGDRPDTEGERAEVMRGWIAARPDSCDPHLELADQLLRRGDPAAALRALGEARAADPTDPRIFPRRLEASRAHLRGGPQDGPALLVQCVKRSKIEPEVTDPIGFLLCAEAAIAAGAWPVALGAASAAIREFPREPAGRLLEVRALLGAGRVADAQRQIDRLLQQGADEPGVLQLAHTVYRAAGKPTLPLLGRLLARSAPDFALQQELLESLRQAPASRAVQFVLPSTSSGPVPLQALAALYLARAGQVARAEQTLDAALAASEAPSPACRNDLVAAIAATAIAAAAERPDAELAPRLARRLAAIDEPGPADGRTLLAAARELASTHPRSAGQLHEAAFAALAPADRHGADYALAGQTSAFQQRWRTAEEHWTAALAFADGTAAAEPLARLLVTQGRVDRARTVHAFATEPTDPALAYRLDRPDLSLPLLAAELQRDPADLLAHCLMALAGQPTLADWPPAKDASAVERVELVATLHDPALAALALPRLRALLDREPTSRTNRMLLARALAASGDVAGAKTLYEALHQAGTSDVVFLREVALAATAFGYRPSPTLVRKILDLATTGGLGGSPTTMAYAARELGAAFAAAGQPELGDGIHLTRLLQAPAAAPLTAADLELLARRGTPRDICHVLSAALAGPHGTPRGPLLDRLHRAALALARSEADMVAPALAAAWRDLATDGPRGPLVHLLLALDASGPQPLLDDAKRLELLAGHLTLVARGDDDGSELAATLTALLARDGVEGLAARLEALLREQPTALRLWLARARLLADGPDGPRALADLRGICVHAAAPDIELGWLTLAAETYQLDPAAIGHLATMPQITATPDGAYAAALVALRIGKPAAAELAFAMAGPQGNGMHLFGRALAALQSDAADGRQRASALLTELLRDYPSSSAARNAGTLRNQLAER